MKQVLVTDTPLRAYLEIQLLVAVNTDKLYPHTDLNLLYFGGSPYNASLAAVTTGTDYIAAN